MAKKTLVNDLTQGSVAKKLLLFALPLMLSNTLQMVYGMVDMAVVGKFCDTAGLAAVSIGNDVMSFASMLSMGFGSAAQVVIAQYVGVHNNEKIRKAIGTSFTLVAIVAVIITITGLLGIDWMLGVLNASEEAKAPAHTYAAICISGMIFILGYNTVSSILRGMGDSRRPFVFVAIASVINLIFDYLFVAIMHMGVAGAALATVMGQAFSFIASMIYLYIKRDAFGFDFKLKSFIPDRHIAWSLTKLAIPMALSHAAISMSQLFVNAFVNQYGTVVTAVNGVGGRISHINSVVTGALGTAAVAMVGQNFGAGNHDRVKKVIYISFLCGMAFTIPCVIVIIFWPEAVFGFFSNDPQVLAWAPKYAISCVVAFLSAPLRNSFSAITNGTGNAKLSLVTGIMDGIVARAGLAYLLGIVFNYGIMGFWMGGALAGFMPFIVGAAYLWSGAWKRFKSLAQE